MLIKEFVGVHGVTFSVWRSLSRKLAPGFCTLSTLNGVAEVQTNSVKFDMKN